MEESTESRHSPGGKAPGGGTPAGGPLGGKGGAPGGIIGGKPGPGGKGGRPGERYSVRGTKTRLTLCTSIDHWRRHRSTESRRGTKVWRGSS